MFVYSKEERWRMTHRSAVYALIVEQSFLQGDFLRSDLLSCHILSTGGGGTGSESKHFRDDWSSFCGTTRISAP